MKSIVFVTRTQVETLQSHLLQFPHTFCSENPTSISFPVEHISQAFFLEDVEWSFVYGRLRKWTDEPPPPRFCLTVGSPCAAAGCWPGCWWVTGWGWRAHAAASRSAAPLPCSPPPWTSGWSPWWWSTTHQGFFSFENQKKVKEKDSMKETLSMFNSLNVFKNGLTYVRLEISIFSEKNKPLNLKICRFDAGFEDSIFLNLHL